MRPRQIFTFWAVSVLLLFLIPVCEVRCQDYVEYKVQVNRDSSADWAITKVSGIDTEIDASGFQERVITLVDAAANETHREMAVDEASLQMMDEISWEMQSRKTVYAFKWQNFSISEDQKITFGDVFRVTGFFERLYGEGALRIGYPPTYAVLSVSPRPDERDDSSQTLKWLGTQYFVKGEQEIVLVDKSQSTSSNEWQQYAIIVGLTVAVAALLVVVYVFRRRRSGTTVAKPGAPAGMPLFESDEEKIIRLIRSSGGTMRQSAITEQCRFSKAKTSQLLAVLEQKRVITRYKRGRDKIVTLNERVTGEHQ